MRVGILGGGVLGEALVYRFFTAGHEVVVGTRASAGSYERAARQPVVLLAIAWPFALDVVRGLREQLTGRVLIDCTNPESADGGLTVGTFDSGAEAIARAVPRTRVVKAFNYLYAEHLRTTHAPAAELLTVLYCCDDARAGNLTATLIESCGFDPLYAGELRIARFLEPLAMLTVGLVRAQGWGPLGIAWRVHREIDPSAPRAWPPDDRVPSACETCGRPASLVSRERHVLCGSCFLAESQSRLA